MDERLADVVLEIERHAAANGWDAPPRLYALVPTTELLEEQPGLAQRLGIDAATVAAGALTPVEQEPLPPAPLDEQLAGIGWPPEVVGCALVQEVVVLPPSVEEETPPDGAPDVATWAASHPERRDVRLVVAVLRDGSRASALRVRGPDEGELLTGDELAPTLADALLGTLTG